MTRTDRKMDDSTMLDDIKRALRLHRRDHDRSEDRPAINPDIVRTHSELDQVARFVAEARDAGFEVSHSDPLHLPAHLQDLVKRYADRGRQSAPEESSVLIEPKLCTDLPALGQQRPNEWLTDPSDDQLFSASIGIVGAEAGIAETGSIIRTSKPGRRRSFALVPPVVIFVLDAKDLLPDLYDWLANLSAEALDAHAVIITGPSKTADIGMKLVTGIHGPGRVHIVLVADELQ